MGNFIWNSLSGKIDLISALLPKSGNKILFLFLSLGDCHRITYLTQNPTRVFRVGFVNVTLGHLRHSPVSFLHNRVIGRLNLKAEIFFSV